MKQYRLVDVAKAAVDTSMFIEDVLFVNDKDKPVNVTGGSASTPYVLPAAAENALGGVKLANVRTPQSPLRLAPLQRRRSTTRS